MTRSHIPLVHKKKDPKPKSRLTRGGRIKPVSAKMAKISKIYRALKLEFIQANPVCQWWLKENGWFRLDGPLPHYKRVGDLGLTVWGPEAMHRCFKAPYSEECHHTKGRGKYMLDVSTWMAISSEAHRYLHDHVAEAYAKGYMLPRT